MGLGVLVYGIVTKQFDVAALGGGMAGVVTAGYGISRGLAKG